MKFKNSEFYELHKWLRTYKKKISGFLLFEFYYFRNKERTQVVSLYTQIRAQCGFSHFDRNCPLPTPNVESSIFSLLSFMFYCCIA